MARKTIKHPSLFVRSGYCIDCLMEERKLGFIKLERQIRINQYEAHELEPPAFETVRDYTRLYRALAFEPNRREETIAPWLLALELEFSGSAFAFFHPLFDLLFFPIESAVFWQDEMRKVPPEWIAEANRQGQSEVAKSWIAFTDEVRREHRKKDVPMVDPLSFIHLSLLRLPEQVRDLLMARPGLAREWSRRYGKPETETGSLLRIGDFDALAALCLMAKEGAEIGDLNRFRLARKCALELLPQLPNFKGCRRIAKLLTSIIQDALENQFIPRGYSKVFFYGFGLPMTWRAMAHWELLQNHLLRAERKFRTE